MSQNGYGKNVLLRGIAKIKVSKKDLDKEIKKTKKSLFKHSSY